MSWIKYLSICFVMVFVAAIGAAEVNAQAWRDANSESVRLYRAGEVGAAAEMGQEAARLYRGEADYSSQSHATLAVQSSQMYSVVEDYRGAVDVLRETINFIEDRSNADEVLIGLYISLSEAEALRMANIPNNRSMRDLNSSLGNAERAYNARKATIDIAGRVYGEDDPRTAQILTEVAVMAHQLRQTNDAISMLSRAKGIMGTNNFPDDHPLTMVIDLQRGNVQYAAEHFNTAEEIYTDLVPLLAINPENVATLATVYKNMAHIYVEDDDHVKLDALVQSAALSPNIRDHVQALYVPKVDISDRVLGNAVHPVDVRLTIDGNGHVTAVEVVNAGDLRRYRDEITDALMAAHFVPVTRDGRTVMIEGEGWTFPVSR